MLSNHKLEDDGKAFHYHFRKLGITSMAIFESSPSYFSTKHSLKVMEIPQLDTSYPSTSRGHQLDLNETVMLFILLHSEIEK